MKSFANNRLLLFMMPLLLLMGFLFLGPASTAGAETYKNPISEVCDNVDPDISNNDPSQSSVCQDNDDSDPLTGDNGLILKVTYIIATVAGIIAVIMIIVAGTKMITSGGDPAAVKTARTKLLHAMIGLVIIALAQTLVVFSINMFL